MPRNRHLKWAEITDFSGGLWTNGSSYLMPPTAFQTMSNCLPQPAGGLRAFFKPTNLSQTGLSVSTHRPVWLETMEVHGYGRAWCLLTANLSSSNLLTCWLWEPGSSTWEKVRDFTTATRGQVTQYSDSAGNAYFIVGISGAGGEAGFWKLNPRDNTSFVNVASGLDLIRQYQSRLISTGASDIFGSTIRNRVIFTEPGGLTFPADNYIDIFGEKADDDTTISGFVPYQPGKLLVSTVGAGWFSIDGDLSDPIVTEMGSQHAPAGYQRWVKLQEGVPFFEVYSGVYLAENYGSSFRRLDPGLTAFVPTGAIDGALIGFGRNGELLFAPGGRVLDMSTGAWFTLTAAADAFMYHDTPSDELVYALPYAASFLLPYWRISDNSARYETYTVKTAPLHDPGGRQTVIEEVEVQVKAFGTTSTVAVTVNGTTRTSSTISSAGTYNLHFRFRERAHYLDVQVVPASNTTDVEAPIIEALRIGTLSGHELR